MAIISTTIISVSTLLTTRCLSIPHFQRPYKWSVKNVVQLIEDVERFRDKDSYRIGTIIVNKDKDLYKIVDGQQRTLTLCLIIKAIHSSRKDLSSELKKELANIIRDMFQPLFKSDISKRNITENYSAILRRVRLMDEPLIKFLLYGCKVTYLVIDDVSEAFQFFDSQNSRGKELDPHDLLKAYHLREISKSERPEADVPMLVEAWESMESKELAALFSNFLFRIRGWSKGDSSRHFTKADIGLFKGINLDTIEEYPYTKVYQVLKKSVEGSDHGMKIVKFPFQIDQIIINGQYFFQMITHYKEQVDSLKKHIDGLTEDAEEIINTLNNYAGKDRTGDKYVRMLFDCALLYYIDKFGTNKIEKAIYIIFIWAYSLRLTHQSLQLASVDNYVTKQINIFKKIRDSILKEEVIHIELAILEKLVDSEKTKAIKDLFIKLNYYYE